MTFLGFTGAINFITCFVVCILVIIKNLKNPLNRSFFNLNLSVALYSFGYLFWQLARNEANALFWFRVLGIGIILINITYLYFVFYFLGLIERKRKLLRLLWAINIIFVILNITSNLYTGLVPRYNLGFWPIPTILFHIYLAFWFWQCLYGFYWLITELRKSKGLRQLQIKYFTISAMFGFAGGATNWPMWYNIHLPPYFNIMISLYISVVAYAIFRYRFMDIKVALTRAGIFVVVYTLVLGVPFGLAGWGKNWLMQLLGQNWFWAPMSLLVALATAGPFIYIFLQRRAEKAILKEDLKKYDILKSFSRALGITKELELDRLTRLIIYRLVKTMNISYGAIYLLDDENKFVIKATRSFKGVKPAVIELSPDDDFIKFIKFWGKGFMYEDLPKIMTQKANNKESRKKQCDADLSKVLIQMEPLNAKLVIPYFLKDELIGFLVLGEKVSSRAYSEEDIIELTTLSRSAGLAITNAISMIKLRDREREFADAARIIEIGNYASGTEHQLGNVLNSIVWGLFGVKTNKTITNILQHNPEALADFYKSLDAIITDAKDGGAIIKEIRDYSQQGVSKEYKLTSLKEVLDKTLRILLIHINKFQNIDIPIDIAVDVPDVMGSPVGLQQVFINMFNNGYDSIQEMKEYINSHPELGITDYKGRIEVLIRRVKGKVEIHIIDNGKGIPEDVARKLFGAHFTTKGSLEKRKEMDLNGGTGIGLFIMRRIIFDHGGTIALFRSEPLKGADFIIQLPVPKQ